MVNLGDFSAVFQVAIAFYGVYAAKSKDIGNTLIFDIIKKSLKQKNGGTGPVSRIIGVSNNQ